ncbi:efflux transporter outer membrane subunit [Undibacterium baiyunense]|uniref:Efflux transporter outer membrane subunit n=1 Tax=Undibacterium baiyunense TaxID=2828731 RepID=A0A941I1T7_9BURK|nr:efflux transporter outer membrane subunit [Undibacterium baiyunense]MBR7745582.1 efflux transporter outer membrane subunit [Undibacterium baiyunense]
MKLGKIFPQATGVKLLPLVFSLSLAGCISVGPDYQRPQLDLPQASQSSQASGAQQAQHAALKTWWKGLQDPVLDQLIEDALKQNQDLLIATARMEEAKATAGIALANRFPTVDANLTVSRSRTSENSGKLPANANLIGENYQFGLSAAYELDLFGKLSRADEAAKARLLSQQSNRDAVQISLIANVAQTYFSLRAFDAQLAFTETTLKSRQENLALQRKRHAVGAIGDIELHYAESELAASEIAFTQAKQALRNVESSLAVLVGRTPKQVMNPEIPRGLTIQQLVQNLPTPAELPSDLLARRPDLVAAEQVLVAANADVGQAKSAYFPSVRLTTSLGRESRALEDLFNPASLLWNVASSIVQPVFRAGAVGAVVDGAEARKRQALGQYVQTVQNAFRDVHDSLNNAVSNAAIDASTQSRLTAVRETYRLSNLRYQSGYSAYVDVLNAQRDLMQAEIAAIDSQRAKLSSGVALYKAVGGGWGQ